MAEQQPQAAGQTTYQLVTLTPGLADSILKDDSPQILQDQLWQFLSIDLSTANLTEVDFLNMLDFVDIAFSNLLNGIPEDQWQDFRIEEIEWTRDPNNEQNVIPMVKRVYPITELWDAIRVKVYIKCCKSRGGFILNTLTVSKQQIEQLYEERGKMLVPGMPAQPSQEKKSWRPW